MTEETTQDGQKTVVAFIAGLLVGGLLVWIFNDTPAEAPTEIQTPDTEETTTVDDEMGDEDTATETEPQADAATTTDEPAVTELPTGEGSADVSGVEAGTIVSLDGATFPTDEGWVAVRTYTDGELGWVLGASRYSREQGLVPEVIELLSPTVAGRDYAIVFFNENGDREFDLATDAQVDTDPITFTAQ